MPPGARARTATLSHIPAPAARRGCPGLARGNAPCEPWAPRRVAAASGRAAPDTRRPPPAAHPPRRRSFLPSSLPPPAVTGYIKLALPAGKANPAPPVGPALGAKGVNIMDFCKQYNAATQVRAWCGGVGGRFCIL